MRVLVLCLVMVLAAPIWAEQSIEHKRKVIYFELPGFEKEGHRVGEERTVVSFVKPLETGKLRVDITISNLDKKKDETAEDVIKKHRKRFVKKWARSLEEVEIEGTHEAIRFYSSKPFEGANLVLFTKDWMCRMMITASQDAPSELKTETLEKLVATSRVEKKSRRKRTPTSPG